MCTILDALDAFLQKHRRYGELDGGVEGERVWMACSCGGALDGPLRRKDGGGADAAPSALQVSQTLKPAPPNRYLDAPLQRRILPSAWPLA